MPTLKALKLRSPLNGPKVPQPTPPLRMTEEEFIKWDSDEQRVEWADGEVEFMNAVALDHARSTQFVNHLLSGFVDKNDLGEVYAEPFQIRLPSQRRRRSPDLFFISKQRLKHLEERQFNGAPDLIVEVVSPESQNRDRRVEFLEYESAGVREYWLTDPSSRIF